MQRRADRSLPMIFAFILLITAAFTAVNSISEPSDLSARAALSQDKDSAGYTYVDSREPDPKVEFAWIDATDAILLQQIKYYYHGSSYEDYYQTYYLQFNFEFYGRSYNKVDVMAHGTIFPGSRNYNSYYLANIPYEYGPNGFIAPWHGAVGANFHEHSTGEFRVYAKEGETYGEKWVCFQWEKAYHSYLSHDPSYQITFQAVLFESGLIKFQYKDVETSYSNYAKGGYSVVGIESPDGTTGVEYSYRSQKLENGLAVMFGKRLGDIESVELDTDEGGTVYAMSRYYTLKAAVMHPINNDMIRTCTVVIGNGYARLEFHYDRNGRHIFHEIDPNDNIQLDLKNSRGYRSGGRFIVEMAFTPTFDYPSNLLQDIVFSFTGTGIMPTAERIDDIFWVETRLKLGGFLEVRSGEGENIGIGGWVQGGAEFYFTGLKAEYPQTSKSPLPGSYSIQAVDELGNLFVQEYVEGYCMVPANVENDLVAKTYLISIGNVPPQTDLSDIPEFILNVDPFKPSPPTDLLIHSDSYEDPNTEFDNENEVFVTWEPAEDLESGIAGYWLSTDEPALAGEDSDIYMYIEHPVTSVKLNLLGNGVKKLYIWALDRAGNPSIPTFAVTNVDRTPVSFSEFSPGSEVWVNTHTPVCSILIDDGAGSGISAREVEYSISTTSMFEYGAWLRVSGIRDADQIRISVTTNFANGKTNYIRFRAKDQAGNGWTYSDDYNVWVDEEDPLFTNFRPYEGEYQNSRLVVVSVDITDLHGSRDGSGVVPSTIQYRYSTSGLGLFGDWLEASIISYSDGVAKVSMELEFSEGDQNFIQYRCYDEVGNYAVSREYNIKVNSAPIVDAVVSDPINGLLYTTDEKIFFDASRTYDLDGDDLEFEWYSDIDDFLSGEESFFRALSPGVHAITLIVNDPAHSVVKTFEIKVYESSQIDPETIDTDGDGLYDAWERLYGLNPNRPDSFYDSDFDSFSNMQEFQNRTDPTRADSHPQIATVDVEEETDDDLAKQYQIITLILIGVSLIVIVVLILLFFSKRSAFKEDVEEAKELEKEEQEYRKAMELRKSG
ncbi:MAG: hypothetical protein ACMUIG_06525 [Thermoplasmatota archaeon]